MTAHRSRWSRDRLLAGPFFLLLLSACAGPQTQRLLEQGPPSDLPPRAELERVPFFPQKRYQCGPAALATTLNDAGLQTTPEGLKSEVYVPEREGSLRTEIRAATRARGLVPYPLDGDMTTLLRTVADGRPVLVMQNLGLSWLPRWHYAVVVGYDLDKRDVILRSGRMRRRITEMDTFELTWARSGHWAQVMVPPDDPPKTAHALPWLHAAHELEETGRTDAALTAYRTATRRWPDMRPGWMALGNSAYAAGSTDEARRAFLNAVQLEPHASDGWNNLAYALAGSGDGPAARDAAMCAVELAPNAKGPRDTLDEIRSMTAGQAAGGDPTALPRCPADPEE